MATPMCRISRYWHTMVEDGWSDTSPCPISPKQTQSELPLNCKKDWALFLTLFIMPHMHRRSSLVFIPWLFSIGNEKKSNMEMLTLLHLYFPIIASAGTASNMKVTLFICFLRNVGRRHLLQRISKFNHTRWRQTGGKQRLAHVGYRRKIVTQTM